MAWEPCWIQFLFSNEKVPSNKEMDILKFLIVWDKSKDTLA